MSATAHIQKYSKNEQNRVEYFIKVFYNGREWGVWKTYSDFTKFDEYLRKSDVVVPYRLPGRNWWNRFDPELLNYRQRELQAYLNVLLTSAVSTGHSLVKEFLEVEDNFLQVAKQKSFRELNSIDRLKDIVQTSKLTFIQIPLPLTQKVSSKKLSFDRVPSRGPSLGTSFNRIPSLTAWGKKTEDISVKDSAGSSPVSNISSTLMRLASTDLTRTLSYTSNSNIGASEHVQAAVVDIAKIEAFRRHCDVVYEQEVGYIDHLVNSISTNSELLKSVYNDDSEAIRALGNPHSDLVGIMRHIADEEMNLIIEVSPKTVLTLTGSGLVHPFRRISASKPSLHSRSGILRRSVTISGESVLSTSYSDSDTTGSPPIDSNMNRKPKAELRLRKTPSEIAKRSLRL